MARRVRKMETLLLLLRGRWVAGGGELAMVMVSGVVGPSFSFRCGCGRCLVG